MPKRLLDLSNVNIGHINLKKEKFEFLSFLAVFLVESMYKFLTNDNFYHSVKENDIGYRVNANLCIDDSFKEVYEEFFGHPHELTGEEVDDIIYNLRGYVLSTLDRDNYYEVLALRHILIVEDKGNAYKMFYKHRCPLDLEQEQEPELLLQGA